jgi:hypothetical protein
MNVWHQQNLVMALLAFLYGVADDPRQETLYASYPPALFNIIYALNKID